MNSQMRIQVIAEARQALAQLRAVRTELAALRRAQGSGGRGAVGAGAAASMAAVATAATAANKNVATATTGIRGFIQASGGMGGALSAASGALVNWGKNLQWAGRQLEFRVTLPLLALGAAGWKFAMDFERSMTRVRKVYGNTTMSMAQVNEEVDKIQGAFVSLSNIYGVHADVVADIGAVYAQAGAEGAALVEVTEATMQAMILGNLNLEESTKGIITIMDAYKLSTTELTDALALLNLVENESPANMQDLIEVIEKSGSVARTAGVDIRELAAITGALIPAAGGASEVGNSLKSTILRVMAPTKQASDAIRSLGINMEDASWKSATFNERIDQLAVGWRELGQEQKLQVARDIAGLRQGNRFVLLMEDRISAVSAYRDLLEKTGDAELNQLAFNRELQTYLTSAPQQWDILTNRMRNNLMSVMLPLLPAINNLVAGFAALARKFEALDPQTQSMILWGAVALAALGPIVAYIGTLGTMLGFAGKTIAGFVSVLGFLASAAKLAAVPFLALGKAIAAGMAAAVAAVAKGVGLIVVALKGIPAAIAVVGKAVLALGPAIAKGFAAIAAAAVAAPWWAIVAVVAAVLAALALLFSDTSKGIIGTVQDLVQGIWKILTGGINNAVRGVIAGISALPRAFANMFRGLIRVVAAAVRIVREWLSYLNPFKRHSPSLVDNVRNGVRVMNREFQKLTNAITPIQKLASAVRRLGSEMAAAAKKAAAADLAEKIRLAAIAGVSPDTYRGVVAEIEEVERQMDGLDSQIKAHEGTIKGYEDAIKGLEGQVKGHEQTIKGYEQSIKAIDETIKGHEQTIKGYEQELKGVEAAMKAQEDVIEGWQDAMDAMDDTIERENEKLSALQETLSALNDELSESKSRLSTLRNTPIAGTYAFEDLQFANTQEQNQLKLQLALLSQQAMNAGFSLQELRSAREELRRAQESAVATQDELTNSTDAATAANDALTDSFDAQGASADEVRNRMALLAGEIEGLRGESLNLRLAGAGSDVLAGLDQQIGIIDASRRALAVVLGEKVASGGGSSTGTGGSNDSVYGDAGVTADEIPSGLFGLLDQADAIQRQLDKVGIQGEIINLQKGLALDPGNKAISDAFRVPEMSVGAILGGINAERANIAALESEIASVTAEIEAQEAVIAGYLEERKALEASYEAEQEKLEQLQDQYDAIQEKIDAVQEVISGLNDEQAAYQDLIGAEQDKISALTDEMDAYQDKISEVNDAISALSDEYDKLAEARDNAQDTLDAAVDLGRDIEAAEEAAAAAAGGGGGGGVGGVGGDFDVPGGVGAGFDSDTDLDELIRQLQEESDALFEGLNPFNDLQDWFNGTLDSIGGFFGSIRDYLAEKAGEVTGWFTDLWEQVFGDSSIGDLWDQYVMAPLESAWDTMRGWWESLEPAIRAIWDPIWENIVQPLWEGIQDIWGALGRLKDTIGRLFNEIWETIQAAWETILNLYDQWVAPKVAEWSKAFEIVVGIIIGVIEFLAPVFQTVWEAITIAVGTSVEIVTTVIAGLIDFFGGLITWLTGVFTGDWQLAWEGLAMMARAVWETLVGVITAIWDGLWATVKAIWENIAQPLLSGAWNWLKDVFGPGVGAVWEAISTAFGALWTTANQVWNTATGWIGGIVTWVTTNLSGPLGTAFSGIGTAFQGIWSVIETAWNGGKGVFQGAIDWINNTFLPVFTGIPGFIGRALSSIGSVVGGAVRGIGGAMSGGINAGISVINGLIGGVNRVLGWFGLGGLPYIGGVSAGPVWSGSSGGGYNPSFGSGPTSGIGFAKGGLIPAFARGGIPSTEVGKGFKVNRARAIVGEGSKAWPEYVIPTDPKYRNNAMGLLASLIGKVGLPSDGKSLPQYKAGGMITPGMGLGDVIGTISGVVSSGISWARAMATKGWIRTYNFIRDQIYKLGGSIGGNIGRGAATYLLGKADDWVFRFLRQQKSVFGGGKTAYAPSDYVPATKYGGGFQAAGGLIPLMNGGIVRGGRGGIAALIGEGRSDEAVIPLDRYTFGRTVNIYGDVTLPDVTDVDEFLANLEAMAEN